jgi:hypothetical protein
MNIYDRRHLKLRERIYHAFFEVYNTRHKNNLFQRLYFVYLCNLDIKTAPYINKENDFPTFYYLAEYYYKYGTNPIKSLQTCLNGISYKFSDVAMLYTQLEILIQYFRRFPQLQLRFDYKNDCLYDEDTGLVITDVKDFFKTKRNVINNETR